MGVVVAVFLEVKQDTNVRKVTFYLYCFHLRIFVNRNIFLRFSKTFFLHFHQSRSRLRRQQNEEEEGFFCRSMYEGKSCYMPREEEGEEGRHAHLLLFPAKKRKRKPRVINKRKEKDGKKT